MRDQLAWGILGSGNIAKAFATALASSTTGTLLAIGSRTAASAEAFGAQFNVPRRYGSYDALLADPQVQAVYISTPHPHHAEWAIKAADAGKHILCEKPMAMNYYETMAIVEAAQRNDVFLMEAFMYRCHPQTAKLVELLRARVIGDVRVIQATFSFHAGYNPESRLLKNALGGGGIMDVGCYCASMARLIAGAALGGEIAEPLEVKGTGHIGATHVDEWAVASLKFPGNIIAELATGVQVGQENVVRIYGSEGSILIPSPWFCSRQAGETTLIVRRHGEEERQVVVPSDRDLYTIEADTVAACLAQRQAAYPAMSWADSLGNARTLDQWRKSIGLVYEAEQPAAWTLPVDKRPLTVRADAAMPTGTIAGVDKPVSRLIMGTMAPTSIAYASVMYDDFFARGGTAFDCAHVYGGGASEVAIGQWVKNRGLREQVVIIGKGGHTPFCTPDGITRQLQESLDRLQMDYLDLYLLHRDNLELPVAVLIDALEGHRQAGRLRAFGVSNWTLPRIEAANAYAAAHGIPAIAAVSNNLSLARMVQPVWQDCLSAADAASRAWFTRTQMPLLAWSSQARGFFTVGHPENRSDPGLVDCWYSEDNFQRLARAQALAQQYGVSPLNIALAYVLCQPFPVYALVGPQTLAETRTTLPALDLQLSPEELQWLNLETDVLPAASRR